jgi:hypothetical protein
MKLKTLVTRKLIFITALIILLEVISVEGVVGQVPPPPPPPPPSGGSNNGHNQGGNQGTPGAPIGGGFEILLVLGALYSGKKMIALKVSKED